MGVVKDIVLELLWDVCDVVDVGFGVFRFIFNVVFFFVVVCVFWIVLVIGCSFGFMIDYVEIWN